MTLEAIGLLIGSLVCGATIARLDYYFVISVSVFVVAMTTAGAPFLSGIAGFMVAYALRGVADGFFYCGLYIE